MNMEWKAATKVTELQLADGQIWRLKMTTIMALNYATIMPPYHRDWGAKATWRVSSGLQKMFPIWFSSMTSCFKKVGNLAALLNPELLVTTRLTLSPPAPFRICVYWQSVSLQAPITKIVFKFANTSGVVARSSRSARFPFYRPDGPATELITIQCNKSRNISKVLMYICSFMFWGSVVRLSLTIARPIHDVGEIIS